MGGCQNYDPFLGTLNIRGRVLIGIQKGTVILTTTHMVLLLSFLGVYLCRGLKVYIPITQTSQTPQLLQHYEPHHP